VGTTTEFRITLEQDVFGLDEVVVVGYGTMKKSDLTGSVVSLDQDVISSSKSSNIIEILQGVAPGVDVTSTSGQAGAGINITIRGNRSLGEGGATNDPLYIVDGIQYNGNLNLNPNDIESIEILKDASSTAIYGVAGANGVIIINTKKGRPGEMQVSFNAYRGVTSQVGGLAYGDREYYLAKKRDVVRAQQRNYDLTDEEVDAIGIPLLRVELEYIDQGYDYDWFNEYMKDNGLMQDYNLSFRGGNEKTSYSTSISYFNEESLIDFDNYNRFTLRSSMESHVNDHVSVGTSILGSKSVQNKGLSSVWSLIKVTPLVPATDSTGEYITYITENAVNPYLEQQNVYNQVDEMKVFSTFYVNFRLFEGLNFRSSLNAQFTYNTEGYAQDRINEVEDRIAYSDLITATTFNIVQSNLLTYTKQIDDHKFNITAGVELQQNKVEQSRILAQDLLVDGNLWYSPTQAQSAIIVQLPDNLPNYLKDQLLSYFGRIHYNFREKYIFQASLRYDGASQLAPGNKWSPFPSASIAWRVKEEAFMENVEQVSNLKLRLGYGVTGNRSVPQYSSIPQLNLNPLYAEFGLNSEQVAYGYRPERLGNLELGWERTASYNLGVDIGFLSNRFNITTDIYKTFTYDLLQERTFPITSGFSNGYDNIGDVTNRGVEFSFYGMPVKHSEFQWTVEMSFSINDEKITALGDGRLEDLGKNWFVGQPIDVYYDYVFDGIWQEDEAELAALYHADPGDLKFKDLNGDTLINAEFDKTIVGTPRPKWIGGLSTQLTYKNFDLNISALARIGQTITDEAIKLWSPNGKDAGVKFDYWTPGNPLTDFPAVQPGRNRDTWYEEISRMLYTDGSYVKIKDITLGYSLPSDITRKMTIDRFRIYISLKNYFIFSDFLKKGRYDPEMEGAVTFPMTKMVSCGVNVDF